MNTDTMASIGSFLTGFNKLQEEKRKRKQEIEDANAQSDSDFNLYKRKLDYANEMEQKKALRAVEVAKQAGLKFGNTLNSPMDDSVNQPVNNSNQFGNTIQASALKPMAIQSETTQEPSVSSPDDYAKAPLVQEGLSNFERETKLYSGQLKELQKAKASLKWQMQFVSADTQKDYKDQIEKIDRDLKQTQDKLVEMPQKINEYKMKAQDSFLKKMQDLKKGEKETAPKEFQYSANRFANMALKSHNDLEMVIANGYNPSGKLESAERMTDWMRPDALRSESFKKFENAKINFVNAIKRKESGASIQPWEIKEYNKIYFPEPLDSPEVLEQKRQNRMVAIATLAKEAGPAYAYAGEKPKISDVSQSENKNSNLEALLPPTLSIQDLQKFRQMTPQKQQEYLVWVKQKETANAK